MRKVLPSGEFHFSQDPLKKKCGNAGPCCRFDRNCDKAKDVREIIREGMKGLRSVRESPHLKT